MAVLYLVVGVAIGNVWSSLLWVLDYLTYNHCGLSEHWFTKNMGQQCYRWKPLMVHTMFFTKQSI